MDGAAFDLGDARGDADHDAGLVELGVQHGSADEFFQHVCGDIEIGDDAVLQRTDRGDGTGGTADHFFCFCANGNDLVRGGAHVDGDDGGLADDDALALDEDERVGSTKVDTNILSE